MSEELQNYYDDIIYSLEEYAKKRNYGYPQTREKIRAMSRELKLTHYKNGKNKHKIISWKDISDDCCYKCLKFKKGNAYENTDYCIQNKKRIPTYYADYCKNYILCASITKKINREIKRGNIV